MSLQRTAVGLLCVLAFGCRDRAKPQVGDKGGRCHPNGSCNNNLQCDLDTCVRLDEQLGLPGGKATHDAIKKDIEAALTDLEKQVTGMTENPFNLERDIPETLWALVHRTSADPEMVSIELEQLERLEFIALFVGFMEARVEMAYYLSHRGLDASEDTLDDLADALIARGKDVYAGVYRGELELPPRAQWESLQLMEHVFGDVFEERFDANIYDEFDLNEE